MNPSRPQNLVVGRVACVPYTRRVVAGAAVAVVLLFAVGNSPAGAAVTHEFLPGPSARLSEGVPPGCETGASACLPGRVSVTTAMTVDAGHLWVQDIVNAGKNTGKTRVDEFNAATGTYLGRQLTEEPELAQLVGGVAVGHAGGEEQVYVGGENQQHGAVGVFNPVGGGSPVGVWSGGATFRKAFGLVQGISVDDSGDLETQGDVYVADAANQSGGASVVYVFAGDTSGQEPQTVIAELTGGASGPFHEPRDVAVSSVNGDVLVSDGNPNECERKEIECVIDRFAPAPGMPGVYTTLPAIKGPTGKPFTRIGQIAIDGSGDIYVIENQESVVDQFNANGEFLGQIAGTPQGPFKTLRSIAADPESGDIYVSEIDLERNAGAIDVFGPTAVAPDVTTAGGEAHVDLGTGDEGQIAATFHGTVNPLNEGAASCRFVWGETEAFGRTTACAQEHLEGEAPTLVESSVAGLAPDTTYRFRLQASNARGTNPGTTSDTKTLTTPGPGLISMSATDVAGSSASLSATINPDGAPTTYYFQYGRSTEYEAQVPAAPGASLGAGSEPVTVPLTHVQGLKPESEYHYRVVAVSQLEVEGKTMSVSFPGPDQVFTTQHASGGGELPDGRRWELVSPARKHGSALEGIGGGAAVQAAADGAAISYVTTTPTEESVQGTPYGAVQMLSTRDSAGGWTSKDLTLAHAAAFGLTSSGTGGEYRAFSSDLSKAIVEPFGEFDSLAPEVFPPDSERTPYIRHDATCETAPGSCYQPLLLGCPGHGAACSPALEEHADVPAGIAFGGTNQLTGAAKFVGASADLKHVLVASSVSLTGVQTGEGGLYEISPEKPADEEITLVSLLPPNEKDEQLPARRVNLGLDGTSVRNAVSEDGARVIWSAGGHLYMRDIEKHETVQMDVPEAQCTAKEECEEEPDAKFQVAAVNGSRILFSDTQRLTLSAGRTPKQADLYQCDVLETAGKSTCALTDLTPAPRPGESADVQRTVLGASEDAAWVYFAANGALSEGASHGTCKMNSEVGEGQCDIYVAHDGQIQQVATVAGADYPDWAGNDVGDLGNLTARVSPDGKYLTFMSERSLTGYDNEDAVSGKPDEEVFLYHAEENGKGDLVCASCDPTGSRPHGVEDHQLNSVAGLVGPAPFSGETWIAANIPGWTQYQTGLAVYQSRYLSNSGRLFFNTDDALVARDINDNQDVYEYEPTEVGSCSDGAEGFNNATGGCVELISSGRASGESAFVDASENGDDVFFLTNERLVPEDVDAADDIYDAQVCSSEAPCAESPEPPPPCVTVESCRQAPAPQPVVFGSPASATFAGQGNLAPPPVTPARPRIVKPLTRAQKLAAALRVCAKKPKAKWAACQRQARKKYGQLKKTTSKRASK